MKREIFMIFYLMGILIPLIKCDFSESGEKLRHLTRRLDGTLPLTFCFATDRTSHVTFSIWTIPDLLEHFGIPKSDEIKGCSVELGKSFFE